MELRDELPFQLEVVNEDADGIALGGKSGGETQPHLVQTLLEGVWGTGSGTAVKRIHVLLASYRASPCLREKNVFVIHCMCVAPCSCVPHCNPL